MRIGSSYAYKDPYTNRDSLYVSGILIRIRTGFRRTGTVPVHIRILIHIRILMRVRDGETRIMNETSIVNGASVRNETRIRSETRIGNAEARKEIEAV